MEQSRQASGGRAKARSGQAKDQTIVGIGASAGGLEAVSAFLRELPADTGIALVLVQHLDPKRESMLPGLLAKETRLHVQEARHNQRLQPNCLYVMPHDKDVGLDGQTLKLRRRGGDGEPHMPIDNFFHSLAESAGRRAIGIILSGTASDGTAGCEDIKNAGGTTVAQDESAAHQGMPQSAINSGHIDLILPPADIARQLTHLSAGQPPPSPPAASEPTREDGDDASMRRLFALLQERKNLDFSHYKTTTTVRRIRRRMALNHIAGLPEYAGYVQQNSGELEALYHDLLINVTSFFRNPQTLRLLKTTVFPRLAKNRGRNEPIRVWVPGCAAGQEVYSLAMVLSEFLSEKSPDLSMQIFGTDVNSSAIAKARAGTYSAEEVADVPPERLKRFFTANGAYRVSKSLREACIFAPQNLIADPPFSKMDIISCCNLLIYLEKDVQEKIINTFEYSLNPGGYLVIGQSESVATSDAFRGVDDKRYKVYSRTQTKTRPAGFDAAGTRPPRQAAAPFGTNQTLAPPVHDSGAASAQKDADSLLLNRYMPPSVVVDENLEIIQFRGSTGPYLEPSSGKASLNITKMAREGLAFELRSAIHKAKRGKKPVRQSGILLEAGAQHIEAGFEVVPLQNGDASSYYLIMFSHQDEEAGQAASAPQTVSQQQQTTQSRRIGQLERQLAQTREDMRSLTEDQEAANEELQTANEEIVSRNEELQSMNEELETAKEEAEASNEELTTVNDELRSRNEEVSQAREFADAIIRTIPVPLLVLDGELRVTSLNRAFCDTFRVDEKETAGQLLYQLGNGQWDIPSLRELLSDILPKDKSLHGYVIEHDFPSIGRKTMRLSGRKFERGGQQILLIIEDVTEERAQIQQRIDLEKKNAVMAEEQIQLKQLSDSKDEFISLASHQLRTPATVVKQFLGMVLEGYKGRVAKQQREFLAAAYDSNDQQLKIISDLLQIARIDQGQIQLDASRRDIGALLRDTIAAQRPVFREHGQTIHFEPPPRKIHASVDPTLMRSAIDNILDNASKYSAAGAAVEVSLVRRPGAVAAISIADHGSGIYKKDLGRLFEKFSQAGSDSNASGGSGLGLYWARQITSLHGGDIEVSSRKNRGSTFTITFPAE